MSSKDSLLNPAYINVGQQLPVSIYSAERKLLLAKGTVVESASVRERLLRLGHYQGSGTGMDLDLAETTAIRRASIGGATSEDLAPEPEESPLNAYAREATAGNRPRVGVRMSREESGESFLSWILGADEQYGFIVTAPHTATRSLVSVAEGQTWLFRMIYMTAAIKFQATIHKVHFQPFPLLHLSPPHRLEMRNVRASPRVAACVNATLVGNPDVPALITDISVGGLCIAVERRHHEFMPNEQAALCFTIELMGKSYAFKTPCHVMSIKDDLQKLHPQLSFAGVRVDLQSEHERLVLHGLVFERIALGFDALWRVLLSNSR
jgi:hypothetical protein